MQKFVTHSHTRVTQRFICLIYFAPTAASWGLKSRLIHRFENKSFTWFCSDLINFLFLSGFNLFSSRRGHRKINHKLDFVWIQFIFLFCLDLIYFLFLSRFNLFSSRRRHLGSWQLRRRWSALHCSVTISTCVWADLN